MGAMIKREAPLEFYEKCCSFLSTTRKSPSSMLEVAILESVQAMGQSNLPSKGTKHIQEENASS